MKKEDKILNKFIYMMLSVFIVVLLSQMQFIYTEQNELAGFNFDVSSIEVQSNNVLQKTNVTLDYRFINNYHHNINSFTLTMDLYQNDIFVDTITRSIDFEVFHHSIAMNKSTIIIDNLIFDDVTITHVLVTHKTFLQSYQTSIILSIFYSIVLLFGLMVVTKHQDLYLSDIKEVFKHYWWAVLIAVCVVPILASI